MSAVCPRETAELQEKMGFASQITMIKHVSFLTIIHFTEYLTMCGDLNMNGPHGLIDLNAFSPTRRCDIL